MSLYDNNRLRQEAVICAGRKLNRFRMPPRKRAVPAGSSRTGIRPGNNSSPGS
ncbi:hypothetical protein BN871_AC_00960 [Paenibacillus sp. P22]|nr:hypothetical protein BN871_AC_00960 [Paenibacillus sp. P22]